MPTTEIPLPTVLESTYIVVWEYQVKAECQAEFVAAYGPDGEWARFFTLDHWGSQAAMDEFLASNATAYDVLDRRFTGLTVWERRIGGFAYDA
jgi:hypothetical protein